MAVPAAGPCGRSLWLSLFSGCGCPLWLWLSPFWCLWLVVAVPCGCSSRIDDPDRLAEAGDWIIECASGDALIVRVGGIAEHGS